MSYLKNPRVENDHNDAGNVEGAEGRVDDEVGVVEGTHKRFFCECRIRQGFIRRGCIYLKRA